MKIIKQLGDIIHAVDDEGYKYSYKKGSYNNILKNRRKPNKFFRNNIFTFYNIKLHIIKNCKDVDCIGFENLKKAHSKIKLFCKIHQFYYLKTWNQIKNGDYKRHD